MGKLRVVKRIINWRIVSLLRRSFVLFFLALRRFANYIDRLIHRLIKFVLRKLYKLPFLRNITKKTYRFTRHHHRLTSILVSSVFLFSVSVPAIQIISFNRQYSLSEEARTLIGESNDKLTKKITYDEQLQLYQFNKEAKADPTTEGNPLAELQSKVGGEGDKDEQQHSIDIPRDLSKGITYYDSQTELSFKIIPNFETKRGGLTDGHLVFPLKDVRGQVTYTVTNSGLKENVLLYESPGKTFKTSYYIDLPKSLEAKLIEETGEIGIYSADPTLFGNITYGSSDDQARVENARNNSAKTYLTFKIPAPVVNGLNGNEQSTVAPVESKFSLQNNTLTVTTTGLDKADYPLAIDPSVSVDSTTDFQTGNFEDENSSADSGSLARNSISGGTVGSWTTNATNLPSANYYHTSVAYNGYLYNIAGSDVRYAPISNDGSVGSWTSTETLTGGQYYTDAVAYNGHIYVTGGGSAPTDTVKYAKVNSNGSLGSWQSTTSLPSGRTGHQTVVYNGYMYVVGGRDSSAALAPQTDTFSYTGNQQTYTVPAGVTSVKVAAQGADGGGTGYNGSDYGGSGAYTEADLAVTPGQTLYVYVGGSGSNNGGYNGGGQSGPPYNGYSYHGGGASDVRQGGTALSDRKVIAAGGGGAGANGSGYSYGGGGGDFTGNGEAYDGYYCTGGKSGTGSAGGAGGTWLFTIGLTEQPGSAGALGVGGAGGDSMGGGGGGGYYGGGGGAGINHSGIESCAGGGGSSFAGSGTSNQYAYAGSAGGAYDLVDGEVTITAQVPGPTSAVTYAPINANGTLGAWATTSSFTTARTNHQALVYGGYIYVLGGSNSGIQYNTVQYAPINADGTLGTWVATTNFLYQRENFSAVVSQGHLYIMGGSQYYSDNVQYARINTDGSIANWESTTVLTSGRAGQSSVAYKGYIYAIGGLMGNSSQNTIFYSKISDAGTSGKYKSTFMPEDRQVHATVAHNGYYYLIGGHNGSASVSDIKYAPINTDGTLGSWTTNSISLPQARYAHTAVVSNNRIYIMGGVTTAATGTTIYANIDASNGSIGSWSNGTTFSSARGYHATVLYNDFVYAFGGWDGATNFSTAQYAQIYSNGAMSSWQAVTSLPTARAAITATINNGYIYIAGGQNDATRYNDARFALICTGTNNGVGGCSSVAGTIGTWNSAGTLPNTVGDLDIIAYNGNLHIFGGVNASTFYNTTYSAKFKTDGTLDTWTQRESFTTARMEFGSTLYNGKVYLSGGRKQSAGFGCRQSGSAQLCNNIEYVDINSGGGGGAVGWSSGTSFSTQRYNHATVAYEGFLYIIGGFNGAGVTPTHYSDVQKAPILSNGSLGSWVSAGPALPSARSGISAVAHKGYMYVLGGKNSGGYLSEVQRASIDSSTGSLGAWTADTSFMGARHTAGVAVSNGYMYLVGGSGDGPQTSYFDFTGSQQTYTVPSGVTKVKIEAYGADGGGVGYGGSDVGGSGAYVEAELSVTPSEALYIEVGGSGGASDGYNGGGQGGLDYYGYYDQSGGGASDVRQGGTGLANRKIVAGGGGAGGGSYNISSYGGGGGDFAESENGDNNDIYCGGGGGATNLAGGLGGMIYPFGGTASSGSSGLLGEGGSGGDNRGGGGGGGYYGGGGGGGASAVHVGCGGGGGSSYVGSGTTNVNVTPGYAGSGYASDGHVSITYGQNSYDEVQYAQINSNGTLGTWATTTKMTQGRTQHGVAVSGGYIYAAGGSSGVVGSVYRTVEHAPINSNGTLGTWKRTTDMSIPRLNVSLESVNGYLYAIGGYSGSGFLSSVEHASILSSGNTSGWQSTKAMGSIRSSEGESATAYKGKLYITGGFNGVSVALNTTEYTALQSTPRKSSYSKVVDLGTTSNITGLNYTGSNLGGIDIKYKVSGSNGVFGAYKAQGSYSCAEGDSGRYIQIFVTLDDTSNSVFIDSDGPKSILDSITVDYVPFVAPTEKRLRHGAFFQDGALQPFNTNSTQCSV